MNSTAMADDPAKAAGYWGSYACDLPYWTFEDMLKHIKEAHGEVSMFFFKLSSINLTSTALVC